MMSRMRWALLVVVHLALGAWFVPPSLVFGGEPIMGDDYDLHIGQVWGVTEGLEGWGASWIYDVRQFAGLPTGVISDAGSKGWELWTFALSELGLPRAVAFNTWVWLAFVLAPLAVLAGARLFGLGRGAQFVATVLASALWYFDSFVHWCWWVGMVSWALAGALALVPLGLFHRLLATWRPWQAVACGLSLGLVLLVHPYAFFALVAPMGVLYARRFRALAARQHAAVAGVALMPLVVNGWWLLVALQHWHYIQDSGYYAQSGPWHFVGDLFNLLVDPTDSGVIGTRAGFRFLGLALAGVGLWLWRREGDERFLPIAVGLGALLAFSYLGAWIPGARQIQPYRNVLPAAFLAILPAAALLERAWRERWLAALAAPAKALVAVGAFVATQHLAGDVLYFFPRLPPEVPRLIDGASAPLSSFGYPRHFDYRLPHAPEIQPGTDAVVDWVHAHLPGGERVLVDNIQLGERLAWRGHVEVMGGFTLLNVAHAKANILRRPVDLPIGEAELRRYLKTFGIGWAVLTYPHADIERMPRTLGLVEAVHGRRVFRATFPVDRFVRGSGRVRASTNRLEVSDSPQDEDVVLAYHFHERLVCRPGCRVEREAHALDEVGFVRVPAPHPASFAVENGY